MSSPSQRERRELTRWKAWLSRLVVGVGFIGLFATMSCATSGAKMNLVRNRAVFDLGCDSLHVVDLGGNTFGVRGCGTQASYVVVCGGDRTAIHQCTAVLNSQPVRAMP